MKRRNGIWAFVLSVLLVAGLAYQNAQLRWYRDRSVRLQAGSIASSIRTAHDHLTRALALAEKGEIYTATQELSGAQVQLERAEVAERAYSLSLDKRGITGETEVGATGFGTSLGHYARLLQANRYGVEQRGWGGEEEAVLRTVEHDLSLMREALTEELLAGNDASRIGIRVEGLRGKLEMDDLP